MELQEAIEQRCSIRTYLKEEVAAKDLKEIARMGSLAPSVNNFQPWEFVIVTNNELKNKMARIVAKQLHKLPNNESRASTNILSQVEWYSTFFEDAPAVIALALTQYESILEKGSTVSHDKINELRNHPDIQSAGACIQNMLLAATDMGYGACWMSAPMIAAEELQNTLELPESSQLIAFIALGKPDRENKPKAKRDIDEMIRFIN